jgi:polysaccharide export outer membrane protein
VITFGIGEALAQSTTPRPELVQYVRDATKAGQKDTEIQQSAVSAGWPILAINEAIAYVRSADKASDKGSDNNNQGTASGKQPDGDKTTANPGDGAAAPANPAAAPANPAAAPANPASASAGPPSATQPAPATNPAAAPEPSGAPAAGTGTAKLPDRDAGVPDDYAIGTGDVLEINVWKDPDASVRGVVVRPDGKISMPLLKDVAVVGLTPTELQKRITDRLEGLIIAPDVTVVVTGINSKKIYVQGKVKREGPIPYTYRMTVMQALSEAGGINEYAKKKKIYILRNENGKEFRLPFDYDAVLKGQRMELNIQLLPGDMIVIP